MSAIQNLAYTLVQVVHNSGAVAAVGGSLAAVRFRDAGTRRGLAWLVLAGLATQAASGAAFGAVSYFFYHHFPDIAGIAVAALTIKVVCVAIGFLLMAIYLLRANDWTPGKMNALWAVLSVLTVTALFAAAFLRWFS